jgi:RNA ligase
MYSRECRGITFDKDGSIICRPLHKFFNIGELEETHVDNIDWSNVARVMDKRDGSMINTALVDGKIVCKTKKSFDTIQSIRALEFIKSNANYHQFAIYCASINHTPTFEWTSPQDRIVLKYDTDKLVLTHIRDNITGEYIFDIEKRTDYFDIPIVENLTPFNFDIDWLLKKCQSEENKEGYVIQFFNGDMVKLKTPWYIGLHHSVTFIRERDIAKMIVDETIDDFKSYLTTVNASHDKVNLIESRVFSAINDLRSKVETFVTNHHNNDRKTFVEFAKSNNLFDLIMQQYSNKEPRYKEYFIKYLLKDYSLETI